MDAMAHVLGHCAPGSEAGEARLDAAFLVVHRDSSTGRTGPNRGDEGDDERDSKLWHRLRPRGANAETRFNAIRHAVLSRYTVLPLGGRDRGPRALVDALVTEHAPEGPTEEHLVEELAGVIWRKRRLRMAEAATYREKLPAAMPAVIVAPTTSVRRCPAADHRLNGGKGPHRQSHLCREQAETGTPATTVPWLTLRRGTRGLLAEVPLDDAVRDDGLDLHGHGRTLSKAWIEAPTGASGAGNPPLNCNIAVPFADQALGAAYAAQELDVPARYEVHLDRKLERTLSMLLRLKELRGPGVGLIRLAKRPRASSRT